MHDWLTWMIQALLAGAVCWAFGSVVVFIVGEPAWRQRVVKFVRAFVAADFRSEFDIQMAEFAADITTLAGRLRLAGHAWLAAFASHARRFDHEMVGSLALCSLTTAFAAVTSSTLRMADGLMAMGIAITFTAAMSPRERLHRIIGFGVMTVAGGLLAIAPSVDPAWMVVLQAWGGFIPIGTLIWIGALGVNSRFLERVAAGTTLVGVLSVVVWNLVSIVSQPMAPSQALALTLSSAALLVLGRTLWRIAAEAACWTVRAAR